MIVAIDLSDPSLKKIVVKDFRGVNEFSPAADLKADELLDARNIDLRQTRSIRSRKGQREAIDRGYRTLFNPTRALMRYRSSVGLRKTLVHSGDTLYADLNDNYRYDPVVSFAGRPAYHQFNDTVLYASEQYELSSYAPGASPEILRPRMDGLLIGVDRVLNFTATTGGFLNNGYYSYRYSFEIGHGGSFLGETGQLQNTDHIPGGFLTLYLTDQANFSAGSNNGLVRFTRPADLLVNLIPSFVTGIYIYRSPVSTVAAEPNYDKQRDLNLYRIARIDMAEMRAAPSGTILLEDQGIPLGIQIRKSPLATPPRTSLMTIHKSRLWCASPSLNLDGTWRYYPDAIAFSAFEANGMEPFVFFPESLVRVGLGAPDAMTALHSYRNQVLLVWKPNSMWAVLGGDDELDFGIPNISVQLIDGNVGCIAPNSIQAIDGGVAWMSNRGPYVYDGSSPKPFEAHKVQRTMERIPDTRRTAVASAWNSTEREYQLFYSLPGEEPEAAQFNRHRARWNAYSGKWTYDKLLHGVGVALEIRDPDQKSRVLWGGDDVPNDFAFPVGLNPNSAPLLVLGDTGYTEAAAVIAGGTRHKVKFRFQTAFLDDEIPFMDKMFLALLIETTSSIPLFVDLLVDNKYDSRTLAQGISIPAPASPNALIWGVGKWGVNTWGSFSSSGSTYRAISRFADTIPVGKSLSLIVSGEAASTPPEISSITVFYKPLGVRPPK